MRGPDQATVYVNTSQGSQLSIVACISYDASQPSSVPILILLFPFFRCFLFFSFADGVNIMIW